MTAPIVERLHSNRNSYLLPARVDRDIGTAADTITELLAALEGMLTGLGPDGYALPAGAVHTAFARAAIVKAKGGAA